MAENLNPFLENAYAVRHSSTLKINSIVSVIRVGSWYHRSMGNDFDFEDDEEEMIEIESLKVTAISQKQWAEMKVIALQLYKQGAFDKDQFKIAVQSFCYWLSSQEKALIIDEDMQGPLQ